MNKLYLNPYVFFLLIKGKIICWDYKNHNQFELEKEYFERLLEISGVVSKDSPIDNQLLDANLIADNEIPVIWGWDELSKIFHFGTQNIPRSHNIDNFAEHVREYLSFCEENLASVPDTTIKKSENIIKLPKPNSSLIKDQNFLSVLENRRTFRSFNKKSISLDAISTLLYWTFGSIHPNDPQFEELGLLQVTPRKSSPSAGGLHPSEAYLVSLHFDDLPRGIYHYNADSHQLEEILINPELTIGRILAGQYFADNLTGGVFITSKLDKAWGKYKHSRGYRNLLLDIGHLSQTFQLTSIALGLQPWLTGAFLDDDVSQLLNIMDTNEQPMFFLGVGHGDGCFLDHETRRILLEK